jgi:hypothetical protein
MYSKNRVLIPCITQDILKRKFWNSGITFFPGPESLFFHSRHSPAIHHPSPPTLVFPTTTTAASPHPSLHPLLVTPTILYLTLFTQFHPHQPPRTPYIPRFQQSTYTLCIERCWWKFLFEIAIIKPCTEWTLPFTICTPPLLTYNIKTRNIIIKSHTRKVTIMIETYMYKFVNIINSVCSPTIATYW